VTQPNGKSTTASTLPLRWGASLGLILILCLAFTGRAAASFEQVATFADSTPPEQLRFSRGLAVNVTGAGGVPEGTIYAVSEGTKSLLRYGPEGEYVSTQALDFPPRAVAVNPSTGDVFVLNAGSTASVYKPGEAGVEVFKADGSGPIETLGEVAAPGESISAGPGKVHIPSGIAVDSAGVVYISDLGFAEASEPGGQQSRVMVFEPAGPGPDEDYAYTGRVNDIAASDGGTNYRPFSIAFDAAHNLYTASEEAIYEFSPSDPDVPVCKYPVPAGGVRIMTVNPVSGEVFYFTYKDRKIHRLSACQGDGTFLEIDSTGTVPKTDEIRGLTFNPSRPYESSRPPGVLYAASSEDPAVPGGIGYIFAPAEVRFPVVESEAVSSVTVSSAVLSARINPKGSTTTYVFQYLTDEQYQVNDPSDRFAGAAEAPVGEGVLGSGQDPLTASVALSGLAGDTIYRYRVIARSHCEPDDEAAVCEEAGIAEVFRTYPAEAPGLADDRAYELVSPALKNGGEVIPAEAEVARCLYCKPSGFGKTFPMLSAPDGEGVVYEGFPFSTTQGASSFNEYLSKRTDTGWRTTYLSPALQVSNSGEGFVGFSEDLTRGLLYQVAPQLSPSAPAGFANLYQLPTQSPSLLDALVGTAPPNRPEGTNFQMRYAGASSDFGRIFFAANDALTGETPTAPEAVDGGLKSFNLYEWSEGQLHLVNVMPGNVVTAPGAAFVADPRAVSADGARVFWTSGSGQLYIRENAELTQEIPSPGKFLTASADGSRVLLDSGLLYDVEDLAEPPVDLSAGKGGFKGIAGQSDDLSHIYFVDTKVLSGPNAEGKAPSEGPKINLYSWDEGTTTFVASLASGAEDWLASPSDRRAEASPGGRWLAFQSTEKLTGVENVGPKCFRNSQGIYETLPCREVFLYDSASEELTCPSCSQTGAIPLGRSTLRLIENAPPFTPQPRYLTDSGRLYFDTQDSLSPFDTNEGVEDVYQYEPAGAGSCTREEGCVSLISAGHEPVDSNFLAADATGKNVFFTSRDQLTAADRDDLIDLYDAREGGGIAAESEVPRSECQGEACQSVPSPPNDATPASSTFQGPGNVVEKHRKKHRKKKHKRHHKKHKHGHGKSRNTGKGGSK
jgi:hypothetical protein